MWVRTQGHKLINLDNTTVLFVNSVGQMLKDSDERLYEVNTGIPNNKSGSLAAGTRVYCEAVVDALTDAIANHDEIVDLRRLILGAGYESVELRHGRWEANTSNDDMLLPSTRVELRIESQENSYEG